MANSAEYPRTVQFSPPCDLHPIERAALAAAIRPYIDEWPVLVEQLECAKVRERQITGTGSYTSLVIPGSVRPVHDHSANQVKRFLLIKDNIELSGTSLRYGATTLGYIENGYLSCLEIATCDDFWDGNLSDLSVNG